MTEPCDDVATAWEIVDAEWRLDFHADDWAQPPVLIRTRQAGWAALDELDDALRTLGSARAGAWTPGPAGGAFTAPLRRIARRSWAPAGNPVPHFERFPHHAGISTHVDSAATPPRVTVPGMHSVDPILSALLRPAKTRAHWVDAQEPSPGRWRVQYRQDAVGGDAVTLLREVVQTVDAGAAALDELDVAILGAGYVRSGDWEPGQTYPGYVAWIEPYAIGAGR